MTASPFAQPLGISRDPHWDDMWVDQDKNEYVLPHPDHPLEELRAGRASELGKTISNNFTLNKYHQRKVLEGATIRPRITLDMFNVMNDGLTPKEVRKRQNELCEEARNVAGAKEPAALGTGYHKMTELLDAGKIRGDQVPETWRRDMVAYGAMLHKMGIVCVPEYTEKIIWVRSINIAGRFDRLVRYRHCDKWHVEDLKTGRDMQYGWGENPVQLQVYAMATEIFNPDDRQWFVAPEICQELALLHHVPVGGPEGDDGNKLGYSESTLYEVDITTRIEVPPSASPVDLCIAVQQWRKTKRVGKPVARIQVTEDGEIIDQPLTLMEQISLAGSDGELESLWAAAKERKEWRGHHTTRARERREILAS